MRRIPANIACQRKPYVEGSGAERWIQRIRIKFQEPSFDSAGKSCLRSHRRYGHLPRRKRSTFRLQYGNGLGLRQLPSRAPIDSADMTNSFVRVLSMSLIDTLYSMRCCHNCFLWGCCCLICAEHGASRSNDTMHRSGGQMLSPLCSCRGGKLMRLDRRVNELTAHGPAKMFHGEDLHHAFPSHLSWKDSRPGMVSRCVATTPRV